MCALRGIQEAKREEKRDGEGSEGRIRVGKMGEKQGGVAGNNKPEKRRGQEKEREEKTRWQKKRKDRNRRDERRREQQRAAEKKITQEER